MCWNQDTTKTLHPITLIALTEIRQYTGRSRRRLAFVLF